MSKEVLFTTQLEEAEKQAVTSQEKANDLAYQINELERNLTVKTWNVERKFIECLLKCCASFHFIYLQLL